MPDYIPKNVENMASKIRAILEQKGFTDSPLQLAEGELWGLIKDNYPE